MSTYTITINERTKAGKNLVAFLRSLKGVVTFNEKKTSPFEESIKNIEEGKVYKAKDSKDLISQCLS